MTASVKDITDFEALPDEMQQMIKRLVESDYFKGGYHGDECECECYLRGHEEGYEEGCSDTHDDYYEDDDE